MLTDINGCLLKSPLRGGWKRPRENPEMKIMIAYDGSRNARLALAQTITMFRDLKPVITLVAVAENPRDITSGNEDLFQEEVSELKKHLAEAMDLCDQEQVSAENMLLEGGPQKNAAVRRGKEGPPGHAGYRAPQP